MPETEYSSNMAEIEHAVTPMQMHSETEHSLLFYSGCESLIAQYHDKGTFIPNTFEERYAEAILDMSGFQLKQINGTEDFGKAFLAKFKELTEALYLRIYQYGLIIPRILKQIEVKGNYKLLASGKDPVQLANRSPLTFDDVLNVFKGPEGAEHLFEIAVLMAKGKSNKTSLDLAELKLACAKPIIRLEKKTSHRQLVLDGVASAGSASRLIHKYIFNINSKKEINIDTTAFQNLYNGLTKDRVKMVNDAVALLDKEEKYLKQAQAQFGERMVLKITPTNAKKLITLKKDILSLSISNDYGPPKLLLRSIGQIVDDLLADINTLKKISSGKNQHKDESEENIKLALKMINIYANVLDIIVDHIEKYGELEKQANIVASEAFYKVFIISAKKELGKA